MSWCYLLSYRVKDRSITQARVSLITFPPPWNGGIFVSFLLMGLRIRSYVPTQLRSKSWGPGETYVKLCIKAHGQAFLLKEVFGARFELASSAMPNVKAFVRWATGKKLTHRHPKLSLITLLPFEQRDFWCRTCLLRSSFMISGDPRRVIYQIIDMRKFTFL